MMSSKMVKKIHIFMHVYVTNIYFEDITVAILAIYL